MNQPNILTITGATCSGKTTLANDLKKLGWAGIRSFTTRPPRAGEVDGEHYDFRGRDWVSDQQRSGRLVEYNVHGGHVYGVTTQAVERAAKTGCPLVAILDPNGARAFQRNCARDWRVVSIFLDATEELILQRLLERFWADGNADAAAYARRISIVTHEEVFWLARNRELFSVVTPGYSTESQDAVLAQVRSAFGPLPTQGTENYLSSPVVRVVG